MSNDQPPESRRALLRSQGTRPGHPHRRFAEPHAAFDNRVSERLLRLRVALFEGPMREGRLLLQEQRLAHEPIFNAV